MEKQCVICFKELASYRCPNCRERYCSVPCCNKHKEICQEKKKTLTNTKKNQSDEEDEKEEKKEEKRKEESTQRILNSNEKEKIRNSNVLKEFLKSKRLREQLYFIDNAENNRQIELKRARKNQEFENFINILLSVIEEVKEEQSIS